MSEFKLMNDQLDIMVTTACQARCPFCVQEATFKSPHMADTVFLDAVRRHVSEFHALGGRKVIITGGEPLLSLDRVLGVLQILQQTGHFDLKALYTNGEYLEGVADGSESIAQCLASAGLDSVNLSVHHFDEEINRRIFGRATKPATAEIATALRAARLDCRFNLVLQKGGIDTFELLNRFVEWAFELGARDIYFREIFRFVIDAPLSNSRYNPLAYCQTHHVDAGTLIDQMLHHNHYQFVGSDAAPFRQKTERAFLHLPTGKKIFIADLTVGTEDRAGLPYLVVMPNGLLYRGWLGAQDRIDSIRATVKDGPFPREIEHTGLAKQKLG
jgi:molybdenum cofactor biosynthesis enzyme MoaA